MKGVDKKTKKVIDMLLNIDTFDLVSYPSFNFKSDEWYVDSKEIEIKLRKDKINKILRKEKIKYILKNYGSK